LQKIYIVEDDDNIRELVVYALSAANFGAQGFVSGDEFYEAFADEAPDMVILDIMLPGEDGISILRKLRSSPREPEVPVIMLTAKGSEYDRIRGLDLGADDYISKPFSVMELISRVRAVLRRSGRDPGQDEAAKLTVGEVTLCAQRRSVVSEGAPVELTFKEFELLQYLMKNEGVVLTRNKILDHIWGFDYAGETRTVDMHIKTIRQKLGKSGGVIKTVRNVGYKMEE
jgi:two-component system alkaline phosphatase synthesis response regulator PhoP